jgi:phytoene desaturase
MNASDSAGLPQLATSVLKRHPMIDRSLSAPARSSAYTSEREHNPRAGVEAGEGRRAVVIGAGLGGLSAAIHLARQGWQVDVIERNARSGGRMNVIEAEGFKIDMGPTMLMMPEVIEKMFTACGRNMRDYLDLQRLTPAYRICWPDGATLDMGGAKQDLKDQVRRIAPEDADRLPALIAAMEAKYLNARYNFIEQPFNSLRDLVRPSTIRGLVRALPLESVYKFVSKHVRSEKLRQAFTFQTLYLGMSPFECPSIYALLPYIETEFGVWFPRGGTIALADALERLLRELGGELHFCRPVERITLDGRRATGVRTVDGREWRADVVVCNMDAPMAYQKLLPPEARRKHTDSRLDRRDYGCSGYLLYLGVKRMPGSWEGHNMILLSDDYEGVLDDICRKKALPRDPAMHVCIPTRTDPSLAPPGHDVVYVLAPCPNTQSGIDWEREGPILRERILNKLEATGLPGLRANIVFERAFTPPDFVSHYGCYAGAAYSGLTPSFLQSAYFRPHNRSEDVRDLYFVGASTHPGGGVPIVLTSGRLAAEEIAANVRR